MTLNFPDSPSTGDIYDDSTSGFRYEWNGTVWISTDPARAANIKELDDISSGFNGSTTQFNLTVSSSAVSPVSDAQVLISVGGVMQNPTNDYTVSGSTITFTTAPSAGLTFFGVFLGQALSLNTIQDGTVTNTSFKAGTAGVGIQSGGTAIGVGITQINFIGIGNTLVSIGNTVNVSIASSTVGINTLNTSYFKDIVATGNLTVTGDLVYDEERAVNSLVSGVTTTTGLNVLGISSVKDLRSVGVTTLTSAGITNLTVSAGSTFNGNVDLGNATSDTITATGRFDSDIVPSTDNARDLGASGLEFKDLYIDGTANIDSLAADTAAIGDLTSGRVTYAGSSGELQDNAGLTFDGTTLAATRLAAPVAFTTSLTAANVDVTGITTIRDDLTLKGASANITFDKSTDDLIFDDGAQAIFGTSSDGLEILHDGSNSYIKDGGTGDLIINANTIRLKNAANSEHLAIFDQNNYVFLYYDDTKRFETTSVGINVVGNVDCDSLNNAGITTLGGNTSIGGHLNMTDAIYFPDHSSGTNGMGIWGTGSDLKIYANGSNSIIAHSGDGDLLILAQGSGEDIKLQASENVDLMVNDTEIAVHCDKDGAVQLRHNNNTKLETAAGGISVTGSVSATSYTGDGSALTGVGESIAPFLYNPDVSDTAISGSAGIGIGLTFNKKVVAGSGTATLKIVNAGTAGTTIQSWGVSSATYNVTQFSLDGLVSALTINQTYQVDIPATFIDDSEGNSYVGTAWTFTAQDSNKNIYTWGSGSSGRLGQNNTPSKSSPVQIPGNNWAVGALAGTGAYSAGSTFYMLKNNGTLWAWGSNSGGGLGQGLAPAQFGSRSSPIQIGSDTTWKQVAAGDNGVSAVKTDGTLWSWGENDYGKLGLSNTTHQSSPTQVGSGTDWEYVARGSDSLAAIKTDGTLWTCGKNEDHGQLGHNNRDNYSSPRQVPGTNWRKWEFDYDRGAIATRTDGTLWTVGQNTKGQLGLNHIYSRSSPTQVGSSTDWSENAVMEWQGTVAVKTNGTLWTWGRNYNGMLGQNQSPDSRPNKSSPVQVPGTTWGTTLGTIGSGTYSVKAVKTDGTLWTWGGNNQGQLGLNQAEAAKVSSPTQIGSLDTWVQVKNMNFTALALLADTNL